MTIPDILPTIADGLGIEMPWKVDGSTANEGEGSDTVRVVSVSKPYAEALAQRDADLAAPDRAVRHRFVRAGVLRRLDSPVLGMPAGLIEETGEGGTAVVDAVGSRLLRDLPADARRIPSPLEATLTGVAKGDQLALALNNRVVAVAQAFQDETGPVKVSFLIPEDAFRPGNNRPRIFRVTDDDQLLDVATSLSG